MAAGGRRRGGGAARRRRQRRRRCHAAGHMGHIGHRHHHAGGHFGRRHVFTNHMWRGRRHRTGGHTGAGGATSGQPSTLEQMYRGAMIMIVVGMFLAMIGASLVAVYHAVDLSVPLPVGASLLTFGLLALILGCYRKRVAETRLDATFHVEGGDGPGPDAGPDVVVEPAGGAVVFSEGMMVPPGTSSQHLYMPPSAPPPDELPLPSYDSVIRRDANREQEGKLG